jgi:transaldolase
MTSSKLKMMFDQYQQSPWFDNIRRDWLDDGTLARLVEQGVRGVTSNPAIFQKSFSESEVYSKLVSETHADDAEELFESLAVADVQDACDVLRPVYESSILESGSKPRPFYDGYVSIEVSPNLAHDTSGTVKAALNLWQAVNRPNVMIKIPATKAGLPAITEVLSNGINVNVTLIFSVQRYKEVLDAWRQGISLGIKGGRDVTSIASVASFFVSRVDAAVDSLLGEGSPLLGRIANAQVAAAYMTYLDFMENEGIEILSNGAQVQRPLWASTSTKNPNYDPLLYVNSIIAPETVNTMPDATLAAATQSADANASLLMSRESIVQTANLLKTLPLEIDMDVITHQLEIDGVAAFIRSYEELIGSVAAKMKL